MTDADDIAAYHERTQHHLHRYAPALGYLDWATQPDPFRRYVGAERLPLALRPPDGQPTYRQLFAPLPPRPFTAASVAQLFEDSLALSAWKQHGGQRWSLRVNPSSGNLHPTEAYLLAPPLPGLAAGLYHYAPDEHALELRAELPPALQPPPGTLLVGLTSIAWREAWKYGERALRYCMHDAGHALGALGFAAAALGWQASLLPLPDAALAAMLGIADQRGPEAEHADALLLLRPHGDSRGFVPAAAADYATLPLRGTPAPLSAAHHDWPAIDAAIEASRLKTAPPPPEPRPAGAPLPKAPAVDARRLFRQRRSAVAMDGRSSLDLASFAAMLARAAAADTPPLQWLPWRSRVHLILFVHRVDGLPPGVYCLTRGGQQPAFLRARMRAELLWEPVAGIADLHLLLPIDCRAAARTICCHQDIAADSAFAVAMLAEFAPTLQGFGGFGWRLLHQEAGALGQLLYLEAEAAGRSATGIGCFFDPSLHELLGIATADLRTVYHFTVGGAVDDPRLQTLPPYSGNRA